MKKYHREVFAIDPSTERTIRVIGLESEHQIDAYDALNAASKHMKEIAPGLPCYLKVYCGGKK
ncbi:hypothetical protein [Microcoleus sp. B13-B6]|uniref:hypothetical protein n=1 Tax=Microcoleus sp. B13-B6 TaxID=2818652 RepID=UPI002FCF1186